MKDISMATRLSVVQKIKETGRKLPKQQILTAQSLRELRTTRKVGSIGYLGRKYKG